MELLGLAALLIVRSQVINAHTGIKKAWLLASGLGGLRKPKLRCFKKVSAAFWPPSDCLEMMTTGNQLWKSMDVT